MKALVLNEAGSSPAMSVEERQVPEWREGYSLVRVHAATVNPLSNWIRKGMMSEGVSLPLVLSNDGSGVIERSAIFAAGTKVAIYGGGQLGITEDGLQQQWALIEDSRLTVVPDQVSLAAAAALPVNYVSAYQALHRVGRVLPGETVLISGASGSIGHALIQLTRAIGARPIGIVSQADKAKKAVLSGAEVVIDTSRDQLAKTIATLTDGVEADWAFDVVAGARVGELLSALKPRGSLVCIGFSGSTTGSFDVADLVIREKRVLGYDAHLETDEDVREVLDTLMDMAAHGLIAPRIDGCYALESFEQAYQRLDSRQASGTLLLKLHDDVKDGQ